MASTCPRCGAPNQHGTFCQQCGASLTQVPQAAVPVQAAPPTPGVPPGFQPPNYPPPGYGQMMPQRSGAQPPQRLPLASILGVTIGLLGVIAALAIVIGHHGAGAQAPYAPLATVAPTGTQAPAYTPAAAPSSTFATQPTSAVPTQPGQPTSGVPTQPAQPTTVVPPTPETQPTQAVPQPTQANSGPSQTLSTTTFTMQVPTSWQIVNHKTAQTQNEYVLEDPSTSPNSLDIFAGQSTSPANAQTTLQAILAGLQQQYPDAKSCGNNQQSTIGGVAGTVMPICFTFTPQGGAAVASADLAWVGTNQSGSYLYVVGMMAGQSNQAFFGNASAVLKTVQWGGGQ